MDREYRCTYVERGLIEISRTNIFPRQRLVLGIWIFNGWLRETLEKSKAGVTLSLVTESTWGGNYWSIGRSDRERWKKRRSYKCWRKMWIWITGRGRLKITVEVCKIYLCCNCMWKSHRPLPGKKILIIICTCYLDSVKDSSIGHYFIWDLC